MLVKYRVCSVDMLSTLDLKKSHLCCGQWSGLLDELEYDMTT